MEPYSGVDNNLTLRRLHSRLEHNYHGPWATQCQSRPYPYVKVDFIHKSETLDLTSELQSPFSHSLRSGDDYKPDVDSQKKI